MQVTYAPTDLIRFEDEIAALFADKQIHAPVHLAGGNEEQLIQVFREHVNEQDWVLCSWRSHYHCLLKGVPPEQLRRAILDGKSISLCFPKHKILSSGIVGGTAPIAVGLAMGIKRKMDTENKRRQGGWVNPTIRPRKVVCFIGDMTAETGVVHESIKYAINFDLPVLFVVEDNGLSVGTDTTGAWGEGVSVLGFGGDASADPSEKVLWYRYHLTRPHVGIGKHVAF